MIKNLFTKNLSLKLTALILAVLLELYFYSPENYVTLEVPTNISIINVPSSLMIVEPQAAASAGIKAMVTVRGPNILVQQVLRSRPNFYISVPEGVRDNFTAALNAEDLSLPLGVDVMDIRPSRVDLRFEKIVKKELEVVPMQTGSPAKGYKMESLNILPKKVYVKGPKSELEGVLQVKTSEISLANAKGPKRFDVPLLDLGSFTTYNVNMVSVEANIVPILETKEFKNVELTVLAPPGHAATAQPTKVSIVLEGPQNTMKGVIAENIKLSADGRGLKEGKHLISISANLPEGVKIVSSEPSKISLSLISSTPSEKTKEINE